LSRKTSVASSAKKAGAPVKHAASFGNVRALEERDDLVRLHGVIN